MGQLRNTIRTMVRNEFAARMVEEAKASTKKGYDAKTVYRSSKYIDMWNDLSKGKPTLVVTEDPTKFDFVRRMVSLLNKADQERSTSPIHLEPEQRQKLSSFLSLLLMIPMSLWKP